MTAPPKAHRPALTAAPPTSLTAALLLILLLSPLGLRAATPLGGTPIDDGYHDMYNLQFLAAHLKFQQWIPPHPQDPITPAPAPPPSPSPAPHPLPPLPPAPSTHPPP